MKQKLFGCMTLLASLLVWSCTNDPGREVVTGGETGEEVEVTFSVSSEAASLLSRADDDSGNPGRWQSTIGRATKIDMLVYAVYEENKGVPTLLKQYGEGLKGTKIDENDTKGTEPFDGTESALKGRTTTDGSDGQTIVHVGKDFQEGKPYEITLRLMRNKEYRMAFWAQSSETEAFNTDNLEKVTVNYEGAKNNDELRDAFCKVESFSVSPTSGTNRKVILTRPMAQINVGTTGADYNNFLKGERTYGNGKITHSKVVLTGVANTIDVVADKISTVIDGEESEEQIVAEFGYNKIAAYCNMDIPEGEDALLQTDGEEFLFVNLNHDQQIKKYRTYYPTVNKDGVYLTETFKYISMCYALVPATTKEAESNEYYSSTLSNVKVFFGNSETPNNEQQISLDMVPVHRNWRTNILGGLKYMKDPNLDPKDPDYPKPDPDDPDDPGPDPEDDPNFPEGPDPSTIFHLTSMPTIVTTDFNGEFNGWYDKDKGEDNNGGVDDWESDGPTGDYPDATETPDEKGDEQQQPEGQD